MSARDAPKYLFVAAKNAVSVNNQSSTPLKMRIKDMVYVMHDNRIYAFKSKEEDLLKDKTSSNTSCPEQNIILNLLTTPFFRCLSIVYIVFRLFDNTALIAIIVICIIQNKLTVPPVSSFVLMGTMGLEIFYDIMLNVNKYWALQRLSFFIGLVLYVVYLAILHYKYGYKEINDGEYELVLYVILGRLVAFLLEELVDVSIDCYLHNALLGVSASTPLSTMEEAGRHRHDSLISQTSSLLEQPEEVWNTLRCVDCTLPEGIRYKGSLFAWGTNSVLDIGEDGEGLEREEFSWDALWWAMLIPGFLAGCVLLLVLLLCVVAVALAAAFASAWYCIGSMCGGPTTRRSSLTTFMQELCRV